MDLETDQLDVVTAFLNMDFNEDIYMEIIEGYKDVNILDVVCKLLKSM